MSNNLNTQSVTDRATGAGFLGPFVQTTEAAYTKLQSMVVTGSGGTLRTQFHLRAGANGQVVYAKIYRSGDPVGTEQTSTGETPPTGTDFNEDIAGWTAGDTIEIWGKAANGWTSKVKNFAYFGGLV